MRGREAAECEERAGAVVASLPGMATRTIKTNNPTPHAGETASTVPKSGETPGMGAPPRQRDEQEAADPAELDDPMAGNPDRKPGRDDPRQGPLTDNKAGG
ncbi:MAG: hypothetical protein IT177_18540 [Acidobacteria bacterium]|nr:hypothetical protein [Acidobacteriota bacterium]